MKIKINEKYKPIIDSKADYFIVTGGRGSGKSFGVALVLNLLLLEEYQTILFTRWTMNSAHISVIPEFTEKTEMLGLHPIMKVNKTDITNLENGSNILFRGIKTSAGNQTASLKSIQNVSTFVLDEAEELIDETIFDKIDNSVRNKKVKNRIILILNPTTKEHWIYKRFFEDKGVKDGFNGIKDNVQYIHTTYQDNKENLSKKFLTSIDLLKVSNPIKYNHIFLGGWINQAEGVIFSNWSIGAFDDSLPYGFGMDFGFSPDPDTLVKVAIDTKNKTIYCKQMLHLNNQGTEQLINNLNRLNIKGKLIMADSAEKRLINDIKKQGFNIKGVRKGAGSVVEGIKTMLDYQIVVTEDSTEIIKELNNYCWNDKKGGVPMDMYNHFIDAIRYYVSTITRGQKSAMW